jgi:hypothetical protein
MAWSVRTKVFLGLFLGACALVALIALAIMVPSSHEYDALVMGRLQVCPKAMELLGTPATNQVWGLGGGGSIRQNPSFGTVDWNDLVKGPRNTGMYHYALEKRGGPWVMRSGTLVVGDASIDVMHCGTVPRP